MSGTDLMHRSIESSYTEQLEHPYAETNRYSDEDEEEMYGKRLKIARRLHIAVAGCSHGELDKIYETLEQIQKKRRIRFDLLICCGDFQAVRNFGDLHHLSVPPKYRQLMNFYKYYSGEKVAPVLTIFVGGNHESSGYLAEFPNGGWAAPNIYYMGNASVIQIGGLRIAGLSGIFKSQDYDKGHFERPPYDQNSLKSAYHVRSVDIFRLKQLKSRDNENSKIDIVVTHDWPAGITEYGDLQTLLIQKPYFKQDIERNQLGNPATMDLLHELKPRRWFSAHMHVKFEAEVLHHDKEGNTTKFLALDKPLPRRSFLECLEVPLNDEQQKRLEKTQGTVNDNEPLCLFYDPEWLAILKNTDFLTEVTDKKVYMPGRTSTANDRFDFRPTKTEIEHVKSLFNNDFLIPLNFRHTAPPLRVLSNAPRNEQSLYYRNPQTTEFCEKLNIQNLNLLLCQQKTDFVRIPYYCETSINSNVSAVTISSKSNNEIVKNPEEIDLNLEGEEDEFGDNFYVVDTNPT